MGFLSLDINVQSQVEVNDQSDEKRNSGSQIQRRK